MKRLLIAAALAATTLAAALPAAAQVDRREAMQAHRIEQGVRSGRLTPHEAHQVIRQQHRIARAEHRMRARNGGFLNRHQRERLAMRQERAGHHIWRAKHNARAF